MIFANFVGPSYVSQSRLADCERCVNFYPERNEAPGAKVPWVLYPTPGTSAFATASEGPIRASWAQDGDCLQIAGYVVYELSSTGTLTNRGSVARNANPAQMVSSGDGGGEVGICSGSSFYTYTLATDTLSSAIANCVADQIGYLNTRFLALDMATSTLQISDAYDGATWDPTNIIQRSDAPDRWQGLLVAGQYIWLFGSETSTVLYDAGAAPIPFAVVPGGTVPAGILAPFSAAVLNGVPVWLTANAYGGSFSVVTANGFGVPSRISTHAVETAIAGYGSPEDAVGFVYDLAGHRFYVLTFPSDEATWVYDASTGQWHEWLSWNAITGQYDACRAITHCYAFGKHLVGDRATGAIYELDGEVYSDVTGVIRRMRRVQVPMLAPNAFWVFLRELQIDMQTGIGLSSGQGEDPQVMLRVSRDGGFTWGNELWVSAGAIGQYQARVIWNRLGRFRNGLGVVEIAMTDPVPWRILGAFFEAEVGTH